jgi:hypothetical protein
MAHRSTLALQNEASLLSKRALQAPTQIALLTAWFQRNSSSEVLVSDLLADILARAPVLEQKLLVLVHERAQRRREEQEMQENVTRTEPLFVPYDPAKHSR